MKVRSLAVAVVLSLCTLAFAADDKPVTPVEALKQMGKKVYVEMKVQTTKEVLVRHGLIYLDSEDDFHSARNLCVAITASGAEKFKEKGIADLATHFKDKTIRVRGEILIFETRPYLPVTDPSQIEVVPAKN